MGGAELVERIRRESPNTKVILISGVAVDSELAGMVDAALAKPFRRDALLSEMARVLKPAVAV